MSWPRKNKQGAERKRVEVASPIIPRGRKLKTTSFPPNPDEGYCLKCQKFYSISKEGKDHEGH